MTAETLKPETCDVLVIGGGPAGSTAAALLAGRGADVMLLEKSEHPRFHIGESLLPLNTAILDRLGLTDAVAAIGTHKPGAEFVADDTGKEVQFFFKDGLDKRFTSSWQVPRAQFDEILFRNAAAKGARTRENTRVTAVTLGDAPLVEATGPEGPLTIRPRFILDASGRDGVLASRLGTRRANKRNNTAAVYAHYRGAEFRTGDREGLISVHLAEDGWFWMIPLPGAVMSVGFVGDPAVFKGRTGTPAALLADRIARSPTVSARMRRAERMGDVTATGNFSYYADSSHGPNHMMIGDAFAFLDPVFSSGVLLAMTAGESGADVAATFLKDPARAPARARAAERAQRHAMARIAWLIYRINTPALRLLFMAPRNAFRMRDGLVSLLAGNLRGTWNTVLPVLAFKTVYYATTLLLRLGLQAPRPTLIPAPLPAPLPGE